MLLKRLIILFLFTLGYQSVILAQYPYEKFPSPEYEEYNNWNLFEWKNDKKEINHNITIKDFYAEGKSLSIQLASYMDDEEKTSEIRVFMNEQLQQKIPESKFFNTLSTGLFPLRIADINGDGLKDLKIVVPYMGNGLAALYVKVIYLFQKKDQAFIKISYTDMMASNRPERDMDGDGNYEIITMHHTGYQNHSYWVHDIFKYENESFKNTNDKFNYPIMIQHLLRENYMITNKIERGKMKEFALKLPEDFDLQD